MTTDISIRIAGQAGQGMQLVASIIGKMFVRHDHYVFINHDVESRIRGGHSYTQVRIKTEPVLAISERTDILVALDGDRIEPDLADMEEKGILLYDGEKTEFRSDNPNHVSLPLERLAVEAGERKIMANSVACGALFALLGADLEPLFGGLEDEFKRKGRDIVSKNKAAADAGYRYIREQFKGSYPPALSLGSLKKEKLLINGSQAMGLGAICAGLKFYAGYPMSPATQVMEFIADHAEKHNIIVEPVEDEIAAATMAIGASFAGVRSMTATSGGGFCLMVEALGLAGMTETPLVIVIAQRPGPATGLPTRTEQSDLRFVMHASHGEFPRAIVAPGTAEQAFYAMGKAFNLADTYQTPVIVLGDQHLNDSFVTVDSLDLGRIFVDRGNIVDATQLSFPLSYRRYALIDDGISPRIFPGQTGAVVYADSDEHTEEGHITEDAQIRTGQMEKRMKKLEGIRDEMSRPVVFPENNAPLVLVGWGSTYGALKEAVERLNWDGIFCRLVHFTDVYPLPTYAVKGMIGDDSTVFVVENNFEGQFAGVFSSETGIPIQHTILKYDGRPFTPQEIVSQVKEQLF